MKFKKGDRVRVNNTELQTYDKTGVVEWASGQQIRVQLFCRDTPLVYNYRNLELVDSNNFRDEQGEDIMMGNYTVCTIKFIEGANIGSEYHYALYDNSIVPGNYVIVKSANHGMGIAMVSGIIDDCCVTQSMRDYCDAGREVVAKFDMSAYNSRVEKRKMAKQLKSEMNKKMKEMQELAMFELMAEKNPELAEMLAAYKDLIK